MIGYERGHWLIQKSSYNNDVDASFLPSNNYLFDDLLMSHLTYHGCTCNFSLQVLSMQAMEYVKLVHTPSLSILYDQAM